MHDAEVAGVKSILLIEDSVQFYSSYLPMLYTEILNQTHALTEFSINRAQKVMRMRARPKVLLARSYEEAMRSMNSTGNTCWARLWMRHSPQKERSIRKRVSGSRVRFANALRTYPW